MIQYDSKLWFTFLFNINSGQLQRLLPNMVLMAGFTALVCYLDLTLSIYKLEIPLTVHTLMGVVLGLVLVFRTNTAYERWWEGRKLFGAMVNSSRNLSVKLDAYLVPMDFQNRSFFATYISLFATLVPKHLRDELSKVDSFLSEDGYQLLISSAMHKPIAVIKVLTSKVQYLRSQNDLSMEQFLSVSQNLNELLDALGGMERIKKTPIPFSYSMLIKRFIAAYVFSLPFGLVHDFGWTSVVIVPFVFYVMVGIELIAEIIENPFGTDKDDLPTDDIAENITRNVKEILSAGYGDSKKERIEGETFEQSKR